MTSSTVPLTFADVAIVASIVGAGPGGTLSNVVHEFQYRMIEDPTYDELSFGLPRLIEAGLVAVSGSEGPLAFSPTSSALAIYQDEMGAREVMLDMAKHLGVDLEATRPEDLSLGRLTYLRSEDLDEAIQKSREWRRDIP